MESITMEEFAQKMKISRSTAYAWKDKGYYDDYLISLDGTLRVLWSDQLLRHLVRLSSQLRGTAGRKPLRRKGKGGGNRRAFDPEALNFPT
jgi:hypothetical protein